MPKSLEREIKKRGGLTKIRTVKLKNGRYMRVYVTRKKGPRGGRTLATVKRSKTRTGVRRGGRRG